MANLTAVLRKTIDGLPNPTPQLRAKVYEKARAAISRQIAAADPPLEEGVAEARRQVLEDSIAETESFYQAQEPQAEAPAGAGDEGAPAFHAPIPPPVDPERREGPGRPARGLTRATPTLRQEPHVGVVGPAEPRAETPALSPEAPALSSHGEDGPAAGPDFAARADATRAAHGSLFEDIPAADMTAPRYRNGERRRRAPIAAGIAVLALVGAAGTAGYVYRDELRETLTGTPQVATAPAPVPGTDAGESTTTAALEAPGPAPAPPSGPAVEEAPPPTDAAPATDAPAAPATPPATATRRFTQRLLPDGTEVDEGPGVGAANAFEEGTAVAAASIAAPAATPEAGAIAGAATSEAGTETAAVPPAETGAVPVGQKAVFYEERSGTEPGSQRGGNVVWSVVSEPPADGQPPEPAIRAVADVPDENLKMTMTIRRNGDDTLPASHVIELQFDIPPDFGGGQIENVQRLALKPTEQARGEPLIGVAGKISDGFFIIALNDLQQAIQSNLTLMQTEQWIDIPLAYSTGQRALMSIEKGIPGERVFKEAMDAWAAKT